MSLLLLLLLEPAHAVRPTEGGLFAYEGSDVVVSWDVPDGNVRVHYAISGPSVTLLDDLDESGVPDFVEDVGHTVEHALDVFDAAGFRAPLFESELGLGPLGGSPAYDVYLVDFDGSGDGAWRADGCAGHLCAGFLSIENDFKGYGYPSLDEAVSTLASHELFHAVQAAYSDRLPVWASEGTAVWAQRLYDPDSADFRRFAKAYLSDVSRSLDKPPAGPVPTFAYATGLWFDYLSLRHDGDALVELLEELEPIADEEPDAIEALGRVIEGRGDTWREAWMDFASWNAATGPRAGALVDGYPYAQDLFPALLPEKSGPAILDTNRFHPLATTYYRLDHPGGLLSIDLSSCDPGLEFRVHPVDGDGRIVDPLVLEGEPGAWSAEAAPGSYWVIGAVPEPAPESVRSDVCLDRSRDCTPDPECVEGGGDTDRPDAEPEGCGGCASSSSSSAGWISPLILLLAVGSRRRPRCG